MQMPIPKTLMELSITKIVSLKDTNSTKLIQSKSKWMKKVTTDRGHWTDLSLKMKIKILRTESMVLLGEKRMEVWSWAIVHHLKDTKSHGWRIGQTLIGIVFKELQGCLAWHLQTGLKLHMFIQEIQIKDLYLNLPQWFTTPISTTMSNRG